jgi:hypothetical protein
MMDRDVNESLRTQQVEKSALLAQLHAHLPQIVARFYEALPLPALSFEPERGRQRLGSYCYEEGMRASGTPCCCPPCSLSRGSSRNTRGSPRR